MQARRKEQHDQPAQEPQKTPFDFAQGKLIYESQARLRRHRNRRYGITAALLILAVGTGIFVLLVADWLSNSIK